MNATPRPETTAVTVFNGASAAALLMDTSSMERIDRLACLMAEGKTTVPKHLQGSASDCFAICLQSMQWGMNPFAVAQKTHLVNGVLGYEAQLVAAVINNSGVVKDRFNFDWYGPWEKVIGKFQIRKGDKGEYRVPGWALADEEGLGVRVWATLKGESQPRVLDLLLAQARVRNSTLWADDPKQQLAYLAQKRWARLYAPDVILGVYSPDEVEQPGEKFMGMAEVVTPAEPEAPAFYSQEEFDKNFPKWESAIASGKKAAAEVVKTVETKAPLTEDQKAKVLAVKVAKAEAVTDVQPKNEAAIEPAAAAAPADAPVQPSIKDIEQRIQAAEQHADLEALDELIGALENDDARAHLCALVAKRADELPPF